MVDADNPEEAPAIAKELGINPGGEVAIMEISPDAVDLEHFEKNTLIPRERLLRLGYQKMGDPSQGHKMQCPEGVTIVCEKCNEGGSCDEHRG